MKALKLIVLLFAVVLFAQTTTVLAGDFANGAIIGDFTFNDGYWWQGNDFFVRERGDRFWNRRTCRYEWNWSFRRAGTRARAPTYELSGDWRSQLLQIAAARDASEFKIRQSILEHQEFLESLKALGLESNFRIENYGQPLYGGDGGFNTTSQYATQQGASIFGYSSIADVYGDIDIGALYEQAIRLAKDSQSYGAAATANAQGLVRELGNNRARVAEILANAQSAREKAAAYLLRSQSSSRGSTTTTGNLSPLATVIKNTCVRCHNSEKSSGGLNLIDLGKITSEQGAAILDRITTTDKTKLMPKGGPPLSVTDRLLFFNAAQAAEDDESESPPEPKKKDTPKTSKLQPTDLHPVAIFDDRKIALHRPRTRFPLP